MHKIIEAGVKTGEVCLELHHGPNISNKSYNLLYLNISLN